MSAPPTAVPADTLTGRAVPMYVHPALDVEGWHELVTAPLGDGFVVVNAADGPGFPADAGYTTPVAALRAGGQPVLGSVDLAYGRRPLAAVLADLVAWIDRYGIRGVFLDRTPSGVLDAADADLVVGCVAALRRAGADRVVLNPGTAPVVRVAEAADAVVTFEGSWADYRDGVPPAPLLPRHRVVHLVHSLPVSVPFAGVVVLAERAGAGVVGASRLGLPNPWAVAAWGPAS
jgi:hypothetical protein